MEISPSAAGRSVVRADLEPADLLRDALAVAEPRDRVQARDDAVGDAGGAAGLHDAVAELRVAEPPHRHAELEDRLLRAAALEARDRAVPGEPEEAAHEPTAPVLGHCGCRRTGRAGRSGRRARRSRPGTRASSTASASRPSRPRGPGSRASRRITRSCPMLTPGTITSSRRLRSVFGGASTAVGSGANRRSTMSVLKRMPLTVSVSGIGRVDSTTSVCGSNFVRDGELQRELVRRLAVDDLVADAHGGDVRVFEVLLGDLLNRRLDLCPVLEITLAHARNLRGGEDDHRSRGAGASRTGRAFRASRGWCTARPWRAR